MIKALLAVLFIIFEMPFIFKYIKAKRDFEIIRMTAIVIIMLIIALVFFAVWKFI